VAVLPSLPSTLKLPFGSGMGGNEYKWILDANEQESGVRMDIER
jgi:hypothetical protein